jgi:hypothetical protein
MVLRIYLGVDEVVFEILLLTLFMVTSIVAQKQPAVWRSLLRDYIPQYRDSSRCDEINHIMIRLKV